MSGNGGNHNGGGTGGGSGTSASNCGLSINLNATLSAPLIIGEEIYGGPASGDGNMGLIIPGGILGGSSTNQIRMAAGSLSSGNGKTKKNFGIFFYGTARK